MVHPAAAACLLIRNRAIRNRAALFAIVLGGVAACSPLPPITPDAPAYVVFFTPFSGDLDDGAKSVLADASQSAQAAPGRRVVVSGYADPTNGTAATDQTLTKLRAQIVADGLVADGVARERIVLRPKGAIGGDPGVESRRVMIELN